MRYVNNDETQLPDGMDAIPQMIDEIDNIDSILQEDFNMGLVCSPNAKHVEHCFKWA